jgi:hypothetical protein
MIQACRWPNAAAGVSFRLPASLEQCHLNTAWLFTQTNAVADMQNKEGLPLPATFPEQPYSNTCKEATHNTHNAGDTESQLSTSSVGKLTLWVTQHIFSHDSSEPASQSTRSFFLVKITICMQQFKSKFTHAVTW